jgi:hypothetical protein
MKRVLVLGGVHGDELNGIEAAEALKGVPGLEVISPANPEAYGAGTKRTPSDGADLNRSFPGTLTGTATQRTAWGVFQRVKESDIVIDLHTGSAGRYLLPHVRLRVDTPENRRLAPGFGLPYILVEAGTAGMLPVEAARVGVPVFVLEAGTAGAADPGHVKILTKAVKDFLNYLETGETPGDPRFVRREKVLAPGDGEFIPAVEAGEGVRQDDPLGTLAGREVRAPRDGVVLGLKGRSRVRGGTPLISIAFQEE